MSDKQLTEEQKKLVSDNHNLIYSFLIKYRLPIEEWYGLAAIGLCKAGATFDNSKSRFSTYAYKCMFTTVCLERRKKKQGKTIPDNKILYYQREIENDDGNTASLMSFIPSKENVEDNVLLEITFDEHVNKIKDRDKQICALVKEEYRQGEIGKIVGCSQAQVSRVKKKLAEYLASCY